MGQYRKFTTGETVLETSKSEGLAVDLMERKGTFYVRTYENGKGQAAWSFAGQDAETRARADFTHRVQVLRMTESKPKAKAKPATSGPRRTRKETEEVKFEMGPVQVMLVKSSSARYDLRWNGHTVRTMAATRRWRAEFREIAAVATSVAQAEFAPDLPLAYVETFVHNPKALAAG